MEKWRVLLFHFLSLHPAIESARTPKLAPIARQNLHPYLPLTSSIQTYHGHLIFYSFDGDPPNPSLCPNFYMQDWDMYSPADLRRPCASYWCRLRYNPPPPVPVLVQLQIKHLRSAFILPKGSMSPSAVES